MDNAPLNRDAVVADVGDAERSELSERVRMLLADDMLEQGAVAPDVIKIDTQGHVIHVLRGLRRISCRAAPRSAPSP